MFQAAREIGAHLNGYKVVVTKSTVPVGTGDEVARILAEARPEASFAVVSNPEFLREGAAISDFKRPDRIVIGTDDERARQVMSDVYRPLYLNRPPLLFTGRRTAELIKYAANAFLAMKVTFINEMADLCERAGADVQEVALGVGLDNRIGRKFLNAGPGFGGSCFPKDLTALMQTAHDFGTPLRILETVAAVNDQRKRAMARKVIAACGGSVRGSTIAVLGLTFKPNTDDMREAPSIALITALQDAGAKVRAYDPEGMKQARAALGKRRVRRACLCLHRRGGRARHRHRVGRLSRARPRSGQIAPQASHRRRPAQHIQAAGHDGTRVHLCGYRSRWPPTGASRWGDSALFRRGTATGRSALFHGLGRVFIRQDAVNRLPSLRDCEPRAANLQSKISASFQLMSRRQFSGSAV